MDPLFLYLLGRDRRYTCCAGDERRWENIGQAGHNTLSLLARQLEQGVARSQRIFRDLHESHLLAKDKSAKKASVVESSLVPLAGPWWSRPG